MEIDKELRSSITRPYKKEKFSKKRKVVVENRKFREKWFEHEDLKDWIERCPFSKNVAYCKYCQKKVFGGMTHLLRHAETDFHKRNHMSMHNQIKVVENNELVVNPISKEQLLFKDKVVKLELALAAWIASSKQEISIMDTLPNVLKAYISDSPTVERFECARTKTTSLIKNVIAPFAIEKLSDKLKRVKFSILVDESTDRTGSKFLVIICRYFCFNSGELKEEFLALPEVHDASANGLKTLVYEVLNDQCIPYSNIIGFASDNASVMLGKRNGLATLIKNDLPWLAVIGCVCHSFSLCSSAACKKLPSDIVQFSHDIYNYISGSAKRQAELKEFQHFLQVAEHQLLYPCATRWLVFESVADRLIEQWVVLTEFFKIPFLEGKDMSAVNLYLGLVNPKVKLFYLFLKYVLPIVNKINVEFQSADVKVHKLKSSVSSLLQEIGLNFINESQLRPGKTCPFTMDFSDPRNFRSIQDMHFGAEFQLYELESIEKGAVEERQVQDVKKSCLAFYIKLQSEIQLRINPKDPLLDLVQSLSPSVAKSGQVKSIVPLFKMFKECFPHVDLETLNTEWRRLPFIISEANLDVKLSVVKFWKCVANLKDGADNPSLQFLPNFILTLTCLPHSSAGAERQFSELKMIKTPLRNRLNPKTVSDLMHVRRAIPDPSSWEIPDTLVRKARKWKK